MPVKRSVQILPNNWKHLCGGVTDCVVRWQNALIVFCVIISPLYTCSQTIVSHFPPVWNAEKLHPSGFFFLFLQRAADSVMMLLHPSEPRSVTSCHCSTPCQQGALKHMDRHSAYQHCHIIACNPVMEIFQSSLRFVNIYHWDFCPHPIQWRWMGFCLSCSKH